MNAKGLLQYFARRNKPRRAVSLVCDSLENRVVLSSIGGSRSGTALIQTIRNARREEPLGVREQTERLFADVERLHADLSAIHSRSNITHRQRAEIRSDSRAIAKAGFRLGSEELNTFKNSLLRAVAAGTYDAVALRSQFDEIFTGSRVSPGLIDKTYSDYVQAAQSSKLTQADLSLIQGDIRTIRIDIKGFEVKYRFVLDIQEELREIDPSRIAGL